MHSVARGCDWVKNSGNKYQKFFFLKMNENFFWRKLKSIVEKTGLKFLLIATDKNPMLKNLESALPGMKIFHADPWLPILDAILLINSKIFVGNCVSSFSAFVFRQRFADGKGPTEYFGVSWFSFLFFFLFFFNLLI